MERQLMAQSGRSRNVGYGTEKVPLASHEGEPHAGRGCPLTGRNNGKHLLVLSFFAFDLNRTSAAPQTTGA